ncbi:theronine dehydrogenase-like Zn-dependent dehydrogenase [Mycolicibacterium chubuense NBB4]|uniref:Theronine dehydrogenase-like Zn-dependent dehydrogenase n=1 Tax=Mycolicibacterium chubuense (strain NBB4) TaxID=710421 RepID=I4BR83_MYCCN|nr:zinc-binding dehydrogenase [Mycolicibacterium chubuense]AFM19790.1 theronine dehydrogenase-like Zn-dependent dehydrogenase [Mycolicibacterium chubuense NBB4]
MKAVSCAHGVLEVVDLPDPRPAEGQLVLEVLRCGICGSDLHAKDHADELTEVMAEGGYSDFMRSDTPVVMGHEFCGVVAERGRKTGQELKEGTTVVSFPLLRAAGGVHLTGLSPLAPGAYAERVLAEASMTFAVPNGLDPATASLTEPMAVAYHAVQRSEIAAKDVAIVLGCGPVGLAVICHLKARGVRTIVASDFSPGRRALATRCGADVVVDPAVESPYEAVPRKQAGLTELPKLYELGVGSMEKLRKLPGWSHVYRLADRLGGTAPKRPVIFECVGVPGMIDGVIGAAPLASRIIVVGVCMGDDKIRPAMAIGKEVDIRFVFGYTPLEFRDTLHMLADGKLDASALVTGTVGLDGVAAAFGALGDPETHAKILIDPASAAVAP